MRIYAKSDSSRQTAIRTACRKSLCGKRLENRPGGFRTPDQGIMSFQLCPVITERNTCLVQNRV